MNNVVDFFFTIMAAIFVISLALLPLAVITILFAAAFNLF